GTAEEDGIEVFELVVGDGGADCGLVADVGERASVADRVEQHESLVRKGALAKDRFDLVADERERIDDAETVPGGMLGIRHAARVLPRRTWTRESADHGTSTGAIGGSSTCRGGNAIDQSFVSGPLMKYEIAKTNRNSFGQRLPIARSSVSTST